MNYKPTDLLIIFREKFFDRAENMETKQKIVHKVNEYGIDHASGCAYYDVKPSKYNIRCFIPISEIIFIGYARQFYQDDKG